MNQSLGELSCAVALSVGLVCSAPALALSPPLVTDDPETPGAGGWEINVVSTIESTRDETFIEAPLFDLNYGFVKNDQLKLEFSVASIDARDEDNHWGISDLLLGYKYRFLDEDGPLGLQASAYPQLSLPTGNRHTGIGSGVTELQLPLQFGKHYFDEKLYVNPEVGYNVAFDDSDLNSVKLGLADAWAFTERLEVMGEIVGLIFPNHGEPNDVFFNVGLEYVLTERVALLASAGRSFREGSAGTPEFTGLFGFEFTFGGTPEEADKD
jgi:hypothetical protein